MSVVIRGRPRMLGDDANIDELISSRRKRDTINPSILKTYLLDDLDPTFAASIRRNDILVAGRNFGCGSAMEVAVTVVLEAGLRAVLARSFARTYFRNAINNELIPIECDTSRIAEEDELVIVPGSRIGLRNATQNHNLAAPARHASHRRSRRARTLHAPPR